MARIVSLLCIAVWTGSVLCEKRGDDPVALESVVQQLVSSVNELKAGKTALQNELAALKAQVASFRCQSGSLYFTPHEQSEVHSGADVSRTHTQHVTFSPPFKSAPQISSGIVHLDSANNADSERIDVTVSNITPSGFDMAAREWSTSHNYGVGVSWIACLV